MLNVKWCAASYLLAPFTSPLPQVGQGGLSHDVVVRTCLRYEDVGLILVLLVLFVMQTGRDEANPGLTRPCARLCSETEQNVRLPSQVMIFAKWTAPRHVVRAQTSEIARCMYVCGFFPNCQTLRSVVWHHLNHFKRRHVVGVMKKRKEWKNIILYTSI